MAEEGQPNMYGTQVLTPASSPPAKKKNGCDLVDLDHEPPFPEVLARHRFVTLRTLSVL